MDAPITSTPKPIHESVLSNELCRRAFRLPTMSARLLHVVLSQIWLKDGVPVPVPLKVTLRVTDILRALDIDITGHWQLLLRKAIVALREYTIESDPAENGATYGFVDEVHPSLDEKSYTFFIGYTVSKHVAGMKELFTRFENWKVGRLRGDYAIRYFQILNSYESMKGTNGNPKGTWFCDLSIDAIRDKLCVPEKKYRGTNCASHFKKKVIIAPITEINEAKIGFRVRMEYKKSGRSVVAVRFICEEVRDIYAVARANLESKESAPSE